MKEKEKKQSFFCVKFFVFIFNAKQIFIMKFYRSNIKHRHIGATFYVTKIIIINNPIYDDKIFLNILLCLYPLIIIFFAIYFILIIIINNIPQIIIAYIIIKIKRFINIIA